MTATSSGRRSGSTAAAVGAVLASLLVVLAATGCTSDPASSANLHPPPTGGHRVRSYCGSATAPATATTLPGQHIDATVLGDAWRLLRTTLGPAYGGADQGGPVGGRRMEMYVTDVAAARRAFSTIPRRTCAFIDVWQVPYSVDHLNNIHRLLDKAVREQHLVLNQIWVHEAHNQLDVGVPVHSRGRCDNGRTFAQVADPAANLAAVRRVVDRFGTAVSLQLHDTPCGTALSGAN